MIITLLAKADADVADCDECGGKFEDDKGIEIEFIHTRNDPILLCSRCKADLARALVDVLR